MSTQSRTILQLPALHPFERFTRPVAIFVILLVASVAAARTASADAFSLSVAATSDIFGAGHAAPPSSAHGSGTMPPYVSLPAGHGRTVSFTTVSGSVSFDTLNSPPQYLGQWNGPDGGAVLYQDSSWPNDYLTTSNPPGLLPSSEANAPTTFYTDIQSTNGISGLRLYESDPNARRVMFLAGVFTSDTEPVDPAPLILDFSSTSIGTSFASLAPLLNQTFFVGDGLTGTGSGAVQSFFVPDAATRLYLGIVDGQAFVGAPDYYDNNEGSFLLQGMVSVPEIDPSAVGSVMGLLVSAVGLLERRRGTAVTSSMSGS